MSSSSSSPSSPEKPKEKETPDAELAPEPSKKVAIVEVERRTPDVVSVLTGAVKLVQADVENLIKVAQQKAADVANVEAHMQRVGGVVAIAANVATAAADDAKNTAEAGISKGLDAAKDAADVNAHLEKAKHAASTAVATASATTKRSVGGGGGGVLGTSMFMSAPHVHVIGNSVCDVLVKGNGGNRGLSSDTFSSDNVEIISQVC